MKLLVFIRGPLATCLNTRRILKIEPGTTFVIKIPIAQRMINQNVGWECALGARPKTRVSIFKIKVNVIQMLINA